ncbi:imidazole glycerol phosphate synthase subunit HisH [Arenimonas sp.]|uniref:imidazole glycerol phosphate synthase subunit HisH n=1 Tax=Arenimonas sp. TaxID=1872635 RepID=UPI0039E72A34
MSPRVVLLDSGGANLGSVQAAFARLGVDAPVSSDAARIRRATHVVLPGVGAAGSAMARLRDNGLDRLIPGLSQPLLGICIGMQLLFESSEEDDCECLGLLPGRVNRLDEAQGVRVPHMGWNRLKQTAAHGLLRGLDDAWMYFVHSFAAPSSSFALAEARHGGSFAAVVGQGRVYGAQFHPERSGRAGARFLQNFLELA